jgi:hypothetical protein
MELLGGSPEGAQETFSQTIKRAEQTYKQRIVAVHPVNILGIDIRPMLEREEVRVRVTKDAALEYLGTLLFCLLDAWSSLALPDNELRYRVNRALATLRNSVLDHKWPKPLPLIPEWQKLEEREFDRTLIHWLESKKEWREYEAQIVPAIAVPTVALVSDHDEAANPLSYFPVWPPESLSAEARSRIRAGLAEIHGAFLDHNLKDDVEYWRRAYDLIAAEFAQLRLLSEALVNRRIPEIVADIVAAAGWSQEPLGRVRPTAIFSDRFGSQFYPPWRQISFLEALKGRVAHWSGQLHLKEPTTTPDPPEPPSRNLKAHRHAILKDFIKQRGLEGMAGLARHLGVSRTALYGMEWGDRKRYSDITLDAVLEKISCSRSEWNRTAKHRRE